ncbi:MAG TPA: MFS transporter [Pseudonocardiaceae bacterium]|jgi:MFS family permease|nr:MFS transporter [Pseudonocardiaceae bacterium]
MSQFPPLPEPVLSDAPPAQPAEPEGKPPWRLVPALALGAILTTVPVTGSLVTLVPARLAAIDPAHKVSLIALMALSGAVVALLANVLFGALSDLTRSRLGARAPWMILGSIGSGATLFELGHATTGGGVVAWWCLFEVFLNGVWAPMVAVIPDRIPLRSRGVYSAAYGAGMIVGGASGIAVGGLLVLHTQTGFLLFSCLALASGLVFSAIALEPSNRGQPRASLSIGTVLHHFSFPRRDARDLYLALGGKLLQVVASYGVVNFQLYLMTDYMHLDLAHAGALSSTASLAGLPIAIALGVLCGIWSDRLHRRKIFVMGAAALAAVAMLFPFFAPQAWAFLAYALITSAAQGVYGAVDQALNTEVLPSRDTLAKDLGIVNIATSGGQVLGPALLSIVVNTAGYRAMFIAAFVALALSAVLIKPIRRAA